MTLNDILNSELSSDLKVEMIKILQKGGTSLKKEKPSYEEWVRTVPNDRLSDNYDLKSAFEFYPFEKLENWRQASTENLKNSDENHLGSIVELPDGNFMFLKLGKEDINPELHYETDLYYNGGNGLNKTHDLIFENGRYWYKKKVEKNKQGSSGKTITPTLEIKVGKQTLQVAVAKTEEEKMIGLSNIDYLEKNLGMLFVYEEPQEDLWFTMEDTSIDLAIIFIDEEGVVTSVNRCKAFDKKPVLDKYNSLFVLETYPGIDIKVGDELEDYDDEEDTFTDEDKQKISRSKMLVLDENGDVLMKLEGGERIFSRIFTRKVIKQALKAYTNEEDSDYIKLGKMVFKELDALDNRNPEYVLKP